MIHVLLCCLAIILLNYTNTTLCCHRHVPQATGVPARVHYGIVGPHKKPVLCTLLSVLLGSPVQQSVWSVQSSSTLPSFPVTPSILIGMQKGKEKHLCPTPLSETESLFLYFVLYLNVIIRRAYGGTCVSSLITHVVYSPLTHGVYCHLTYGPADPGQ